MSIQWKQFLELYSEKNPHLSRTQVLQMAKNPFQQLKQYYNQRGGEGAASAAVEASHNASNTDINLSIREQMPQICFGTVQYNLNETLNMALDIGYRHIDGAEDYATQNYEDNPIEYYNIIKDAIKKIPRQNLWITWKARKITIEMIQEAIRKLDCGYIDLFLVHYGCGTDPDFIEFKKAKSANLIRYYGVSNCEDLDEIKRLKREHDIYANQIQARPPNGIAGNRKLIDFKNFIQECNKLNIKIMLFGSMSGITNLHDYSSVFPYLEDINKYYIQRYILHTPNVLMVGSTYGAHLETNLKGINEILSGNLLLPLTRIKQIEVKLQKLRLVHQ
jgi:diketogulonate reductase-like aldo/keto reductase